MKDKCLRNLYELTKMVAKENDRQLDKWGVQNHDPAMWLTITAEEFGEMARAILANEFDVNEDTAPNIVKEAIQTATLCLKIAEMFSDNNFQE
ncbi:hypothetical protein LCGC14_1442640 [marine sediment metagenome]|uniref:NTP pyrophosphohydrolase MazG putative catalytic core domain-containing protein n=1 Tax=marine sediment metagenome TaxID=412755 RepID=A0A0F9M0M6_9ZZZZ